MSISIKTITCPQCGANINVDENREKGFCSYCGAPIIVSNENEHIYRHVDEAELLRAETEKIQLLNRIKREEEIRAEEAKKEADAKKMKKIKWYVCGGLIGIGLLSFLIGALAGKLFYALLPGLCFIFVGMMVSFVWEPDKRNRKNHNDMLITLPASVHPNVQTVHYVIAEDVLRKAGFKNIKCIPLNDIRFGFFVNDGEVESIMANNRYVAPGSQLDPETPIYISYHSKVGSTIIVNNVAANNTVDSNPVASNVNYSSPSNSSFDSVIDPLRREVANMKTLSFSSDSEMYGEVSRISNSIINDSKGNKEMLSTYEFYRLTMDFCLMMEDLSKCNSNNATKVYLLQIAKKHAMYLRNEANLSKSASEQRRKASENYDKMIYDIQMK